MWQALSVASTGHRPKLACVRRRRAEPGGIRHAVEVDPNELLCPDLDEIERKILRWGLIDWGGPARCTDEMAIAMGFRSVQDLFDTTPRLIGAVVSGQPLCAVDWLRVLLATEIVFVSNCIGSGLDWSITSGYSDEETLAAIRRVQHKLPGLGQLLGTTFGTRYQRRQ